MIEPRISVRGAEVIVDPKVCLLDVATQIQREIPVPFKLEARFRQNAIEDPLPGDFPANPGRGNHGILPLDIDAYTNNELQVWIVDISATDDKRHVEVV